MFTSRCTVADFLLKDWLPAIKSTTKPTGWANWQTYAQSYVVPIIGRVKLQELNARQLIALYEHLLSAGRVKRDTDSVMYAYWVARRKNGEEPTPREVARECAVSIHAARAALPRYRSGHIPRSQPPGLAAKTVRNIHIMLHRALSDAERWRYVHENVAASVKPPRVPRRRPTIWTPAQLAKFLQYARPDRFYALYLLAAMTGMRRAELCGLRWAAVDLDAGRLAIEDTRVVVNGRAKASDGKSENALRLLSLDQTTVEVLRQWRADQASERPFFDPAHTGTDLVFTWEDGRPIHPDVVRQRFNRMAAACGLPRIRLHDVRHSYATAALKAGINPKIVSERLGHASAAFTLSIYTHAIPGMDRDAAEIIAEVILPPREDPEDPMGAVR